MPETIRRSFDQLSDLPNYKASFTEPLREMGITSLEDLKATLLDDSRSNEMIEKVVGIGPKIIQSWRNALLDVSPIKNGLTEEIQEDTVGADEVSAEVNCPSSIVVQETREGQSNDIELSKQEQQGIANGEAETSQPSEAPPEHNLNCTIDDAYEIRQILIDLLQWNGAKKKGLASTMNYVEKRLKNANLTISIVDDDDGDPVAIIASRDKGGLVFWGHLDTAPEGDMEDGLQGVAALDFIYGRGSVDTKGALAALLWAAQRMASWDIPYTVVLTTDGLKEQAGANIVGRNPTVMESKGVLILAPTNMIPAYGQAGFVAMNITISGENSIIDMSNFLSNLSHSNPFQDAKEWFRVGFIRGGKRKDPYGPVVSCQTMLEMLTANPTGDAIRGVEGALVNTNHVTEILKQVEPMSVEPGSPLIKEVEELIGKRAQLVEVSTEASHIVPSITNICIVGPGHSVQTKAMNEYVVLNDLEKMFEMILSLVDRS
jgi:acetylornithine deacetylase/succinyl-diaminopimelate desuccinylase-like protein